jgi:hypothetical protein
MLHTIAANFVRIQTLELDVLNKRKRTPLMLCFSPPHFTLMAKVLLAYLY